MEGLEIILVIVIEIVSLIALEVYSNKRGR